MTLQGIKQLLSLKKCETLENSNSEQKPQSGIKAFEDYRGISLLRSHCQHISLLIQKAFLVKLCNKVVSIRELFHCI
jgi:hypothetical protein